MSSVPTKTSTTRRLIKLKEWGLNEFIQRSTEKSSAHNLLPKTEYTLRTDSLGFVVNGNDISSQWKMFVVGCSFVECLFMEEQERITSVIERELNLNMGRHVEVKNSAMSGMNILHGVFLLLAKIVPLGAKTVLYVCSSNDWRTSRMGDGLYYTKHKNLSIFARTSDAPPQIRFDGSQYRNFLRVFSNICADFNIKCVFCSRPFREDMRVVNDVTQEFCVMNNVPFVDVARFCEDRYSSEEISRWFYDGIHLTAEGSAQCGKIFAQALVEKNIV